MAVTHIAIIGTGAIGTSLGLALKATDVSLELVGHDKKFEVAKEALQREAFDTVEWNLIAAVEDADLITLALPADAIRPTLEAIRDELKPGVVVTDTADVKQPVLEAAREILPADVHFIGGNPLVRTEGLGVAAASETLFRDRRYCLTPSVSADTNAVDLIVRFLHLIGAKPLFMDPDEHDALIAGVRHLPALLGIALLHLTTQSSAWREMATMAGPLYEAMTRLPSDDTEVLREFFLSNRAALQRWIPRYQEELDRLNGLFREGDREAIDEMLDDLAEARARWARSEAAYRAEEGGQLAGERLPSSSSGLASLLGFGNLGRSRKDAR